MLTYSVSINQFQNPQGGPDIIQNYWTDSENESTLNSDWIDISNIGTIYNFQTNDIAGEMIDIGFEFPFYNNSYTEMFINPNGWVGFENDNNNWDNISIPSNQAPRPAIFGFWDDLNPINDFCDSCSGEVYYHSNQDRMVVWFSNVSHWPTYFDNSSYNFQIVIYKNGDVKFNYNLMEGDFSSATIGMQNSNGDSGLMMAYNSSYAENNLTTLISKAPHWVGLNNIDNLSVSGDIIEGYSESLSLILENNQLQNEIYTAYLNISSNASESISLPIELLNIGGGLVGDINNDSVINVSDIVVAVNLVLSSEYNYYADLNSDGSVNVSDIVILVNLILQN